MAEEKEVSQEAVDAAAEQKKAPTAAEQAEGISKDAASGVLEDMASEETPDAAPETGVENEVTRETPELRNMTFFHVDDGRDIQRNIARELKDQFEIENKVGGAYSAEVAIARIRELAEAGKGPDVILLDKQFMEFEEDEEDGYAVDEAQEMFLKEFAKLVADPAIVDALKETKIVAFSGSMKDKDVAAMQAITDRVVGFTRKRDFENLHQLKDKLIETGIARENE